MIPLLYDNIEIDFKTCRQAIQYLWIVNGVFVSGFKVLELF